MNLEKRIGLGPDAAAASDQKRLIQIINLKLALLGLPTVPTRDGSEFEEMAATLLQRHRETDRLLANYLCPADWRIQRWLDDSLHDRDAPVRLPTRTFALDRWGLARALSLPPERDDYTSEIVSTYRVRQGILHNPKSDRRTTVGTIHLAEGGLPIPDDKQAVPRAAFAALLRRAFAPPPSLLRLPFTAAQPEEAECFVSLLLRPTVCPEVPGFTVAKSLEMRFFAPGSLVGNLDFVESIFGNAGDPYLPENDAALDVEHWTGHSGCVVLAPHLVHATKREIGLPHWDEATARQRRDGMCWRSAEERYNGGNAFKLTARDGEGVIVTIIADNYFGYCKKEVKTQISFAANLFGLCEEEHAGGALVFPGFDLGEEFSGFLHVRSRGHNFDEVASLFGAIMELKPEGYGVDRQFPEIIYVPEDVNFDLGTLEASWIRDGVKRSIKLLPANVYVRPSGYKVRMEKPPGYHRRWRLVGTAAEGTLCHKPCTVSGGGKSEISKSLSDAILTGPVFVADIARDFDAVEILVRRDYSDRFRDPARVDRRAILSHERSLGSVIKLLTPDGRDYTDAYNRWLEEVPQYLKELVFVVKRYYRPEWGDDWRSHFTVDFINGRPGYELKFEDRPLVTTYLRVGFAPDGSWRTFGLRKDFHPAVKIQAEDDISATVVAPVARLARLSADFRHPSAKFVENCEHRLFQRPDEAIHPGYDQATEADFSRRDNFFSNYEPLTAARAREWMEDSIRFERFTEPMKRTIREAAAANGGARWVSSANPRLVGGAPSRNPRYLQIRPDHLNARDAYLAEIGARLQRRLPLGEPVLTPVNAVLPGRRNNPPDPEANVRPLCVHNPIHYLELPELFLEFICSMTGRSPSTTGAGSEGALTKGPFNALPPIIDLNAALVSYLITGYGAFLTAAGYVGPRVRVDHDLSLLVPEIWARMSVEHRDPEFLIKNGYLEKCRDFEHGGRRVPSSRLGYRITSKFVSAFFGRVFNHPHTVLTDEMLRPEIQDPETFADSMENIAATHQRVAEHYFADGSIALACPPLRALLAIMRQGDFEGRGLEHPEIRALFARDRLLSSAWYRERLAAKARIDIALWRRHVEYLDRFLSKTTHAEEAERLGIRARRDQALATLERVRSPQYLMELEGTIGAQPDLE